MTVNHTYSYTIFTLLKFNSRYIQNIYNLYSQEHYIVV